MCLTFVIRDEKRNLRFPCIQWKISFPFPLYTRETQISFFVPAFVIKRATTVRSTQKAIRNHTSSMSGILNTELFRIIFIETNELFNAHKFLEILLIIHQIKTGEPIFDLHMRLIRYDYRYCGHFLIQ